MHDIENIEATANRLWLDEMSAFGNREISAKELAEAGLRAVTRALTRKPATSGSDRNVEAVRQMLLERSELGIRKYGTTTERHDLPLVEWLRHLQEELLDGAVYIEAAISRLKEP